MLMYSFTKRNKLHDTVYGLDVDQNEQVLPWTPRRIDLGQTFDRWRKFKRDERVMVVR
jgi:hypothetical protein